MLELILLNLGCGASTGGAGGISNNNICRAGGSSGRVSVAKQINILFVYAENNNYFMVGVVLCSTVYSL